MQKLVTTDEALDLVVRHARPRSEREMPIEQALGAILAEPLVADREYPPFDRAMMDGYAICLADAGRTVEVTEEIAAGAEPRRSIAPGFCAEIMTGASCPPGTGAVVPKEDVTRHGRSVSLPAAIAVGDCISNRGTDCAAGVVVVPAGAMVTPLTVAVACVFGRSSVRVIGPPSLAVITTGDELATDPARVGPTQIRDSNGPMVAALARCAGVIRVSRQHAPDSLAALAHALDSVAGADIVVLCGGVSAGKYDLVPAAVERFGATSVFHKVTQKPGKPLFFAVRDTQLFFGLPGNPLGTHFSFHRFVRAAIRVMMGQSPRLDEDGARGVLSTPLRVEGDRTKFLLARVEGDRRLWQVTPFATHNSADLYAAALANAYLRMPEGTHTVPAGTEVDFEWIERLPS